jgi:hypothetical protein
VLHVGGREDVDALALGDAIAQQPGRAELAGDGPAAGARPGRCEFVHRRPEAAGGVQPDRLLGGRHCAQQHQRHGAADRLQAGDHFFALAKNSCSPPIL